VGRHARGDFHRQKGIKGLSYLPREKQNDAKNIFKGYVGLRSEKGIILELAKQIK